MQIFGNICTPTCLDVEEETIINHVTVMNGWFDCDDIAKFANQIVGEFQSIALI